MHRYAYRGALIGGIISLLLHLVLRFFIRNILWIMLAVLLLTILGMCSPQSPELAAKRAILSSFDRSKVTASNAHGLISTGSWVDGVEADIHNGERARIYDVWLRCEYVRESSRYYISSAYFFGFISPGSVTVRLPLPIDATLNGADPSSFSCEARYVPEFSDLLKVRP